MNQYHCVFAGPPWINLSIAWGLKFILCIDVAKKTFLHVSRKYIMDMALHFLGTAGLGYVKGYLGAMKLIILSVVLSIVCVVILALFE